MKYLIVSIALFLPLILKASSSRINSITENDYIIINKKPYTFISKNKELADWEAYILQRDGEDSERYTLLSSAEKTLSYTFSITSNITKWNNCVSIINSKGKKGYIGFVKCKRNNVCDTIPIFYDVLPPPPTIEDIVFTYDSFDQQHCWFLNSEISFYINSKNTAKYLVFCGTNNTPKIFDIIFTSPQFTIREDFRQFTHIPIFWDQMLYVQTQNEFGTSPPSDTIIIQDYIPSELLSLIKENLCSIENQKQEQPFSIVGSNIHFSFNVKNVTLFDLSGNIISCSQETSILNIGSLAKGTYILNYIDYKSKSHSKKILL